MYGVDEDIKRVVLLPRMIVVSGVILPFISSSCILVI